MGRETRHIIFAACIVTPAILLTGCSALHPPLAEDKIAQFAERIEFETASTVRPVHGVLSVDSAVARAVEFNRSVRVKKLETALAAAKVRMQSGEMLPNLLAEWQIYARDRPASSHSSLSPVFSRSSDMSSVSQSFSLSWNILDFGLAYVRATQSLDKVYQTEQATRSARAKIAEETRRIYWRAVALEKLTRQLSVLKPSIREVLSLSRKAADDPNIDPLSVINFQSETLNRLRELNELHRSLASANEQLLELIGAPQGSKIRLSSLKPDLTVEEPKGDTTGDVSMALRQRPEIINHLYDLRISEAEATAAVLQVLPGITFDVGRSRDSNSYLLHNNWISWSEKIAANLINLVRLPSSLDEVKAEKEFHRQSALATAAAIALQVHIAKARITVERQAYDDAKNIAGAQKQLLLQVRAAVDSGRVPAQALLREQLSNLLSEVRLIVAYSDVQAASAAYLTAVGQDVIYSRSEQQLSTR